MNKFLLSIICVLCFTWNVYGQTSLTNGDFSSMTIGSELIASPNFDAATGWSPQAGWTIDTGAGTATHDGSVKSNMTHSGFTAYLSLRSEVVTLTNTQTLNSFIRQTFYEENNNFSFVAPVTDIFYDCNTGTAPTVFSIRSNDDSGGVSRVLDSVSVKQVTLDSWAEVGTRTALAHACFNPALGFIELDSSVTPFAIKQAATNGDYIVSVDIESLDIGSLTVSDGGANSFVLNSAGIQSRPLTIATSEIHFSTTSGVTSSFVLDSVSITPEGVANDINGSLLHVY